MLTQLKSDINVLQSIDKLKLELVEQKKAGILVIVDGSAQSYTSAYICQQAINQLNEANKNDYICFSYFLDSALFEQYSKQDIIEQLQLQHPINLMLEDALDELVLEVEYSYKKLGMSRHMTLKAKQQLSYSLAMQTAEAIALDMNMLLFAC